MAMVFYGAGVADRLDRIITLLSNLLKEQHRMSAELDALAAQVASTLQVEKSALVLIDGLADRIAAAGVDPALLTALQADLAGSAGALAAAVAANTPAAPAPAPADPAAPPADPAVTP